MFLRMGCRLNPQMGIVCASSSVRVRVILIVLMIAPACGATDRYFHDISVESSNHRYRVEATSPDNAKGPWKRAFQSRFVYRLTDQSEKRQVWSRQQPMQDDGRGRHRAQEGPPAAVYVSDEGWVVIRTADHGHPMELIAISPEGDATGRVRLFDTLFQHNEKRFQYWSLSTAGIRWGVQYCHFYFTSLGDLPCFCLRTWWAERLVINLVSGQAIEVDPESEQKLFHVESQFVLDTLTGTLDWQWATMRGRAILVQQANQPTLRDGTLAIHMAGLMKLDEAAPYLWVLQDCPYVGTTTGSSGPYQSASGGIKPYSYQSLTIRQLTQLSLRRIDVRPAGYQSTKLYRDRAGYWHPEDPIAGHREARVGDIGRGQTPEQVLEKIGAPDFIESKVWEYDIDDSTPYTLLIEWGEEGVEKVSRRTPAKWADGITRDRSLAI